MPITTNSSNKFAFLLASSKDAGRLADIQMVFDTLTQYYNYLPANIWVVIGETGASTGSFGSANITSVTNTSDLTNAFNAFTANGAADSTMLLYFSVQTGTGSSLVLAGTDINSSGDWIEDNFDVPDDEVHIVVERDEAETLAQTMYDLLGATKTSRTSSCGSGFTAGAGTSGSLFTEEWTKGLKFEAFSGSYADEMLTGEIGLISNLISLKQANMYADTAMAGQNSTYDASDHPLYLGKPNFLIRDGDHPGVGLSSDKSPDIILSYTGGGASTDEFFQDTSGSYENKIQVKVLNIGTHPLRKYSVGVIRYDTDTAGTGEKSVDNVSLLNEVLCPIPMPSDATEPANTLLLLFSKISEFSDIKFPTQLHETIRAKAGLETITDLDTWDYENEYSQAQLNISYSGETDVNVIPPGNGKSGYRPEEKFAFLFAGRTDQQYENDIKNVYDTLTNYYGYPKEHIWVVSGGGNFPTATFHTDSHVSSISDKTVLSSVLQLFKNAAGTVNGNQPDILNNAFLYFTGEGSRENMSGTDTSLLVINGAGGTIKISGEWLKTALDNNANFLNNCQVDIFCEQSHGEGFYNDNSALSLFVCTNRSFTSSCTVSETSGGGTSGSNFTDAWIKGLNMIKLTSVPNKYADELTADVEPTDNLLVSLKKAWVYAKELVPNTGFYNELGEVKYLGLPVFLIRDGDHGTLTEPAYESPDIFLTHPNNTDLDTDPINADLYVQDAGGDIDNIINIRVLNIGTHPLREFSVGITRYDTGAGGPGVDRVKTVSLTEQVLCPIPIPVDASQPPDNSPALFSFITKFNDVPFPDQTHKCIRATAQLAEINLTDMDFWVWNYHNLYEQAQRNIDYSGVAENSGGGIPPLPPYLIIDEKMKQKIMGLKEHIYYVYNPFKEKIIIHFPIPRDYLTVEKELLTFKWFEYHENKMNDLVPIKLSKKNDLLFKFELKPKESKKILLYFAFKPDVKIDKLISVPFDILMSIPKHEYKFKNIRRTLIKGFEKKYALMGGFTLKIKQESSELFGAVKDLKENPVRNALIVLQTVNKRQGAIISTEKDGSYNFSKINPDVYRVLVIADNWHTKRQLIHLPGGKKGAKGVKLNFNEKNSLPGSPIKIIIDKIRIKDAHEPFFKGKGEFLFSSVVIPDKDKKRKQVMKIPKKGFIRSSAKRGENEIELGMTVFEGYAVNSLVFAVSGKEIDFFDPDDKLNRYHRYFKDNPVKWYGKYSPDDERKDPENVGDWQIWYRIVRI